jgi:tetratricopeptide (TPR) repeat protein
LKKHSLVDIFQSTMFLSKIKITSIAIFIVSLCFHSSIYYALFRKPVEFSKYHLFAQQYLQGTINPERLVDFSPFYLYLNIFLQKFFHNPIEILLWLQLIAISLSCVLLFNLLRSFFGSLISVIGTALFLLNRSVILYTNVNEPEAFLILFLLCFITCALNRSTIWSVFTGLFLGLCLLIRLNFFPLAILTPLGYLCFHKKADAFRRSVLFLTPVVLAILGLTMRNYSITGTFSPMVMNPGFVFFEGNNPNSNGQNAVYPPMVDNCIDEFQNESDPAHSIYRLIPRRLLNKDMTISEVNAFWSHKAWNFIADNPGFWIKKVCMKMHYFFHNARWHDIETVVSNDLHLQKSMIPTIPFSLISALCLIGIIASFKDWKKRFLLLGVLACQIAVMALTYSSDRQRVSVIFIIVFFACAALHFLSQKSNSFRLKMAAIMAIIFLFPYFYFKTDLISDSLYQRKQFNSAMNFIGEASLARKNGDLQTASKKNILAYVHIPYYIESRLSGLSFLPGNFQQRATTTAKQLYGSSVVIPSKLDLVTIYLESGMAEQALPIVKELIQNKYNFNRTTTQSSQPYFYAARIAELKGNCENAIEDLKKSLEKNPGDPWTLSHLAVLTSDEKYKRNLVRYFDEIDAEYFIGLACLSNRKYEQAVKSFSYVIEKMPEYRDGFIYLAAALGGANKFAEAAQYYAIAMQKSQEPIFCENEIINVFKGWASQEPQNEQAQYFLATTLGDFGYYEDAIKVLSKLHGNSQLENFYSQKVNQLEGFISKYKKD